MPLTCVCLIQVGGVLSSTEAADGGLDLTHAHTWCWAMYSSEPGLLNAPMFLLAPVSYVLPRMVPG